MLDCCVPLEKIESSGIDFDSLECLARCNGLAVLAKRADEISLDYFRSRVKALTQSDSSFLAVSYSRKTFNQTGDGHWSPVGGYDEDSDMVLILDQARFKYSSHWVPLPKLFEAMDTVDVDTKKKRGFFELTVMDKDNGPPLAAHALSIGFCCSFTKVRDVIKKLPEKTRQVFLESGNDITKTIQFVADQLEPYLQNKWLLGGCCKTRDGHASCCEIVQGKVLTPPPLSMSKYVKLSMEAEEDQLLTEIISTRTYELLSKSTTKEETQNIWRAVLVLSMNEEFWKRVMKENDPGQKVKLFEPIDEKLKPELAKELQESRKKLKELL